MKPLSAIQALEILKDAVLKETKHRDYKRTVDYSILSNQFVTAVTADKLLIQYVRREEKVLFDQRVGITKHILPAVANRVMSHFYRVGRLDTVQKRIGFTENTPGREVKIQDLTTRIEQYNGDESVDDYHADRFVELNFLDPNTFVVVDFDSFDPLYEKAEPYPVEVGSENVWNFKIVGNRLQWLLTGFPIKVKKKDNTEYDGKQVTIYIADEIFRMTEVHEYDVETEDENKFLMPNGKKFVLSSYAPKGGEVQAYRVGYKRDLTTGGRTCVSPMDSAYCYFWDCLHTVSNFQLAKVLHAFPQKIQYVGDCPGPKSVDMRCLGGTLSDGSTCPTCDGTGLEITHTSPQDALYLKKPRDAEDMIDLEKLLVYKTPPIEVLKFQDEQCDKLEVKILTTIFNAENLVQTTISKTATEVQLSAESRFNALFPYAQAFTRAWLKTVRLIAAFTDSAEGLQLLHKFPNDFKLQTEAELFTNLESANKASAPAVLRQRIALNIAEIKLADDELALLRYKTQVAFTPFQGKTDAQIQYILSNGFCSVEDRILWTHSDSIFDVLEWENPAFFRLARKLQLPIVTAAAKDIAGTMPTVGGVSFADAVPANEEGTGAEDVTKGGNVLRSTVGGGELVIRVQESVSKGVTSYESGVGILALMFDFTDAEARVLLGEPIDVSGKIEDGTVNI